MNDFEQYLLRGEEYLKASRPDLAVPEYRNALDVAPSGAPRMQVSNTLARVLELMGDREAAATQFGQTLQTGDSEDSDVIKQRAIALNNLGRLSLPGDPKTGIAHFDEAARIYEELSGEAPEYETHLAHTYMARGEAYYLREKYWFAKKDYKAAIELKKNRDAALSDEMRALAHYQLGAIYNDEFNAHDSRVNYLKALDLYRKAMEEAPQKYRPLVAACLNNLAVAQIQAEEYDKAADQYRDTLEQYDLLARERPEVFRPYLAATHANLGVLLADKLMRHSEAYQANEKALEIYRELASAHPERYTHYLATAYHNAGIYTLETPAWPQAESFLSKALSIRRGLEEKQPGAFGADFCATALNLLEFYQRKLEEEKNLDYREKALDLLEETSGFLKGLPQLPATENMQGDFDAFLEYFNGVDVEAVRTLGILQKIRAWDEEIDSTLDVDEKQGFQTKILEALQGFYQEYPENKALRKPYLLALNNTAWLHLCKGETPEARVLLKEGAETTSQLPALKCNLAHCDLMEGKTKEALEAYQQLFGSRNESGKDFREVIEADLKKLESYGVLPVASREILTSLEMLAEGTAPS